MTDSEFEPRMRYKGVKKVVRMPKVLLLSEDENEACSLREILEHNAFLIHARDYSEMIPRLDDGGCDVLFCSWACYRDGALKEIRKLHQDLPVIVLSRTGEEREWMEVLGAGAFDLLIYPCQESAVLNLVEQAVASQKARKTRKFSAMPAAPRFPVAGATSDK